MALCFSASCSKATPMHERCVIHRGLKTGQQLHGEALQLSFAGPRSLVQSRPQSKGAPRCCGCGHPGIWPALASRPQLRKERGEGLSSLKT